MRLILELHIDNDDFVKGTFSRDPQAVVSAAVSGLEKLLTYQELRPGYGAKIQDLNGNTVGVVSILQK